MWLRKFKPHQPTVAIALLAALAVLYSWTANPAGTANYNYDGIGGPYQYTQLEKSAALEPFDTQLQQRQLEVQGENDEFTVCGRPTNYTQNEELQQQEQQYATCPEVDAETPVLLLESHMVYGRTMNQMRSLLRAIRYSRDQHYQLVIMHDSWVTNVLFEFFMVTADSDWEAQAAQTMCAMFIHSSDELEGREVIRKNALELFYYTSPSTNEECMASMLYTIRTLYQHYNTGEGTDHNNGQAKDMCSGIKLLLGRDEEDLSSTLYTAIHLRNMPRRHLTRVSQSTGCDPDAGIDMPPDYVKSILGPLDMLHHPIVVISDYTNRNMLKRLLNDPVIGSMIRPVPKWAHWIGGDITIATMATVFIGNPASTFSGFIGQSRVALGFANTYLFMARDGQGEWQSVCDDSCLFLDGTGDEADNDHFRLKRGSMQNQLRMKQNIQ